ncbi:hypothetical protein PRNP1_013021 [Phytophthora ramorum]
MVALKASFTAVVVTTLAALVHGHGYMSVPKCEYTFEGDTTQFMATIEASASGFSGSFSGSPADNTAAFVKGFEASKYTSLKEMVSDLGKVTSADFTMECGYTNPDETAQPLPKTYVEWAHVAYGQTNTASNLKGAIPIVPSALKHGCQADPMIASIRPARF